MKYAVSFWRLTPRWNACSPAIYALILVDQVQKALDHLALRIRQAKEAQAVA